jgi:signal transduction histidine kinase
VIAGSALFVFQTISLRQEFTEHVVALARIVAPYSAAPVAFGDQSGIDRALDALRTKPELVAAAIISPDEAVLGFVGKLPPEIQQRPAPGSSAVRGWQVHVTEPIMAKSETLGMLYFVADFRPVFMASVWKFLPTLGVVLILTIATAGFGTVFVSRMLTRRIATLAETAGRITAGNDYALRAPDTGPDEIGTLTQSFNKMLAQLESNDSSLRSANAALTTEIKERERLQAELLESSRLAGMAEIATGVLHNVGNVLNSVNVSAGIIRDQLAASQLDKLRLSAELIQANRDRLGEFFTHDPRGRLLPEFLSELARQLADEHGTFAGELLNLTRNIEHIKGIVVLQQNYAKSTAVVEEVSSAEVFDHALLINQALLAKLHVRLSRDFCSPPPVLFIDRHKLLQILINLVSNAAQATLPNAPENRRLQVGISLNLDSTASFIVSDNGIGISPDIMPRLFTQGFTTRPEGHGFGLHSAALAAKAVGGTITPSSSGPGTGATFIVTVPLCSKTVAL